MSALSVISNVSVFKKKSFLKMSHSSSRFFSRDDSFSVHAVPIASAPQSEASIYHFLPVKHSAVRNSPRSRIPRLSAESLSFVAKTTKARKVTWENGAAANVLELH